MRSHPMRLSVLSVFLGTLLSPIGITTSLTPSSVSLFGDVALARSSGGRSGGGSFRRAPSAPIRTQPRSPSSGFGSTRSNAPSYNPPQTRTGGGPIFVPIPTQPRSGSYGSVNSNSSSSTASTTQSGNASNAFLMTMLVLLFGGGCVGLLLWFFLKSRGPATAFDEVNNDTVTVSKLQVALVANAGSLQQELSSLATQANTTTNEGLCYLLQEASLLLLRHNESWTHVHAESQTVPNLDIAQKVFNQLTITERSKLSAETLVNVGGRVSQQQVSVPSDDDGPAAYIVVTLLVGTAHDHPLFDEIRTESALQQTLSDIAALTPDYLCVLELLWSPQDASDSLTYDELLTEYTDLVQI